MHYHLIKEEHFRVLEGDMILKYINTNNANKISLKLNNGDIIFIPIGLPHKICALSNGVKIIEFSTQHFNSDSYRIDKGFSQL